MTRIDLLSVEMLPVWRRHAGGCIVAAVVLLLAGTAGATRFAHAEREAAIALEVQQLERADARLRERRGIAIDECRAAERLAPALARLRSAAPATHALAGILQFLAAALPDDAWLDEVVIDGTQLRVVGASDSRAAVLTFVERISAGDGLGEIELTARDVEDGASFVLVAAR